MATNGDGTEFLCAVYRRAGKTTARNPAPVPLAAGMLLNWLKNNWKGSAIR